MFLFVTVLLFPSVVLASQHIFEDLDSPPAHTCDLSDEDLLLVRDPVCRPPPEHKVPPHSPPEPWTHPPICITTDADPDLFCVYTSSTFAAHRGISILTTPAVASHFARNAAFTNPEVLHGANVEANPPYTIQELPGRGVGVIANRTLHRGDSIFSYTPVFIMHRMFYDLLSDQDRVLLQRKAVDRLPSQTRELFLDLLGHFGEEEVDDIIHTNSFRLDMDGDEVAHTMVIPEISRLNHDCRPNAHYYFEHKTLTHHVHALRTIHAGEELTVSYTEIAVLRAERQAAIARSWGFACTCSLCAQRAHLVRESDRRLRLIAELEEHLDDWSAASPATPEMAERLVALYEQERLHAPVAVAYVYAALAYNAVGRAELAMKHAALAIEITMLNSGPDASDVRSMRALLDDPRRHWSWNVRSSN